MLAVGLVVVLALPWFVYPPVAMDIAAWGLFAISVDLLLGYTGLLSFGHAAFWGTLRLRHRPDRHPRRPSVPSGRHRRRGRRDGDRHPDRLPRGPAHRHLLRDGDPGLRADALLHRQPVARRHRRGERPSGHPQVLLRDRARRDRRVLLLLRGHPADPASACSSPGASSTRPSAACWWRSATTRPGRAPSATTWSATRSWCSCSRPGSRASPAGCSRSATGSPPCRS